MAERAALLSSFLAVITVFVLLLVYALSFRETNVEIHYRLSDPTELDLRRSQIGTEAGSSVSLSFDYPVEKSKYSRLFKFWVIIRHPQGVKVRSERRYSEFGPMHYKSGCAFCVMKIQPEGRREFALYVEAEENTSYKGGSPITVGAYMAPCIQILRQICLRLIGALGSTEIDILAS